MSNRVKNLAGKDFGSLHVDRFVALVPGRGAVWGCTCICGYKIDVPAFRLGKGVKSCGCARRGKPYGFLYTQLMGCCKRKGLPCLTFEEFLDFTKVTSCHYCGEGVLWHKFDDGNYKGTRRYNLDRKDNNRGYEKDNLVICCKRCNYGKRAWFSYKEWVVIGPIVRQMREQHSLQVAA